MTIASNSEYYTPGGDNSIPQEIESKTIKKGKKQNKSARRTPKPTKKRIKTPAQPQDIKLKTLRYSEN